MGIDTPPLLPRLLHAGDPEFPRRFADLAKPPHGLWVRGQMPVEGMPLIAVVGSRAATGTAVGRVQALCSGLAAAGWGVISGGALGIDAAAHGGAVRARGRTFAVLGCGIDVVYPDRHDRLFDEIVAGGGALLSEYGPGTAPRRWQFPSRNRLVAALAQAVVVGESRHRSGALITARQALALGRGLFAMPGSAGTDALLASGAARPVETVADLQRWLSEGPSSAPPVRREIPVAFHALLRVLGEGPSTADALAHRMGLSVGEVLGVLSEAELDGLVRRVAGSRFEACFKERSEASCGQ